MKSKQFLCFVTLVTSFIIQSAAADDKGTCNDSPERWKDSRGWTCKFYEKMNWCSNSGKVGSGWDPRKSMKDFAVDDVDAMSACCACGGGDAAAAVPTSVPPYTYQIPPQFLELAYSSTVLKEQNQIVLAEKFLDNGAALIPKGLSHFLGVNDFSFSLSFTLEVAKTGLSTCNGFGFALMQQSSVNCIFPSHDASECQGLNLGLLTDDNFGGVLVSVGDDNTLSYSRGAEKFMSKKTVIRVDFVKSDQPTYSIVFSMDGNKFLDTPPVIPILAESQLILTGSSTDVCTNKFGISDVSLTTLKALDAQERSILAQYFSLTDPNRIANFFNSDLHSLQELPQMFSLGPSVAHKLAQESTESLEVGSLTKDRKSAVDFIKTSFYLASFAGAMGFILVLTATVRLLSKGAGERLYDAV